MHPWYLGPQPIVGNTVQCILYSSVHIVSCTICNRICDSEPK